MSVTNRAGCCASDVPARAWVVRFGARQGTAREHQSAVRFGARRRAGLLISAVVAAVSAPVSADTLFFSNTNPITITDNSPASPYPSSIVVSGISSGFVVHELNLTLFDLSHGSPEDIDALLVGPTGTNLLFLSDAGGSTPVSNINVTFDDPFAPVTAPLASLTYAPTNIDTTTDAFPAPAPAPSSHTALSAFHLQDPNGTWDLFVRDDNPGSGGSIAGGWMLTIYGAEPVSLIDNRAPTSTSTIALIITPAGGTTTAHGPASVATLALQSNSAVNIIPSPNPLEPLPVARLAVTSGWVTSHPGGPSSISGGELAFGLQTGTFTTFSDLSVSSRMTGSNGLRKRGAGMLTISGANAYSGATTLDDGVLRLGASGVIPDGSDVILSGSSVLDVNGKTERVRSIASASATAQILLGSGMLTSGAGSTSFAGNVSGASGKIVQGGGGTTVLSGVNTHTGGTSVEPYGGTLRLTNPDTTQAVPATGQLQLNIGGYIGAGGTSVAASQANFVSKFAPADNGIVGLEESTSNAFDFSVVFPSGSKVRLGTASPVNPTYNNATLVPQGSTYYLGGGGQQLTFSATNVLTGSRNVDVGTSGNLLPGQINLSGNNDYAGTTTIEAGTLSIGSLPNTGIASPIGTGASVTIIGGSGAQRLGALRYSGASTSSNRSFVFGADGGGISVDSTLTLSGVQSGGSLVKLGTGTLVLTNNSNSFSGSVISAGTLSIDADAQLGSTARGGGGAIVLNGGVLHVGGATAVSTSRDIELANANAGGFHITNTSATGLTLNSPITGRGGWIKTGTGTLTLNAAGNSNDGSTRIMGGNVRNASGSEVIPDLARLDVNTGTFHLGGTSETIGSLVGTGNGTVNLGAGNLTFGADNTNTAYTGGLVGAGNLIKVGLGSQSFGNNNPFTGTTTVQSGTLQTTSQTPSGGNGALGNSTSAIVVGDAGVGADAALFTSATTATAIGRSITIASGAGLRTVGVASNGTISGALTLNKSAQLFGSGNGGISGIIGDGGGGFAITKIGSGSLNLSGSNTYSGSTTVDAGALRLTGATGAIASSSAITINPNATLGIVQSTTPITRISTTAPLSLNSGRFDYTTDAAAAPISETFGAVTTSGFSQISASGTGPAGGTTLNFGALSRNHRATLLFTGPVGGTPSSSSINITFPSALPTISDPNGPDEGQNTAIIPFAAAHATATSTAPNTLATYDSNGVRILSPTDASVFNQVTSGSPTLVSNVNNNIAEGVTLNINAPVTINSLAASSTNASTLSGSSTLQIHSGAIANAAPINIAGPTIDFGSNTGYLHMGQSITIDSTSRFTGSDGLAVSSRNGSVLSFLDTNSAASTFTGGLFINGNAAVSFTSNSQLGDPSGGITLDGGKLTYAGAPSLNLSPARPLTLGDGGGGFGVATSFTLTVSHNLSGTGSISKDGIGTLVFTGNNSYSGSTTITDGTLRVTDVTKLGTGPIVLAGGMLATTTTHTTARRFTLQSDSSINVASGQTQTITSPITGTGALNKRGAGNLTLSGPQLYTGATTIHEGIFTLASDATLHSSSVTVNSSTTLAGAGTIRNGVTLNSGATISPGASTGTMTTGPQTWSGGATYLFEVNDAAGTSGGSVGWDRLNMSTLSVTATANSRFTIRIVGLNGNTPGPVASFNPLAPAVFEKIATFVNDIRMSFDLGHFQIDSSLFDNHNTNHGGFALRLGSDGRSIDLHYVPEPSAGLLAIAAAGALLRRWRLHR